MNIVVSKLL